MRWVESVWHKLTSTVPSGWVQWIAGKKIFWHRTQKKKESSWREKRGEMNPSPAGVCRSSLLVCWSVLLIVPNADRWFRLCSSRAIMVESEEQLNSKKLKNSSLWYAVNYWSSSLPWWASLLTSSGHYYAEVRRVFLLFVPGNSSFSFLFVSFLLPFCLSLHPLFSFLSSFSHIFWEKRHLITARR